MSYSSHFAASLAVSFAPQTYPPPFDPSVTLVAACLVRDASFTTPSCQDKWLFNHYIGTVPPESCLTVGDRIAVYMHTFQVEPGSLPIPSPIFAATITHIVGWSKKYVEFGVYDPTGVWTYPRTIRMPHCHVRLSWTQWIWGKVFPFPRSFTLLNHPTGTPTTILSSTLRATSIDNNIPFCHDDNGRPLWRPAP